MSQENKSAQPVLDALEALCGYAATGASNKELAEGLKTSPANVTRAMGTLIAKGWARKNPDNGRFYPAPAFSRLTFRVLADFERAQTKLDDTRRSMTGQ